MLLLPSVYFFHHDVGLLQTQIYYNISHYRHRRTLLFVPKLSSYNHFNNMRTTQNKRIFISLRFRFKEQHCFTWKFPGSPARPSDNSSITMKRKLRMDRCWNDTDRGKPNYLEKLETNTSLYYTSSFVCLEAFILASLWILLNSQTGQGKRTHG